LRVSGSRSSELGTHAEPSCWPTRQPVDEATLPGKTYAPGSTKTTSLMGSSSPAKALSVASLPQNREFNGRCSALVLHSGGLQSSAQLLMVESLDGNGQRRAASLAALPGRGLSASPSVGKLEGDDAQQSPEANGVSTNVAGGSNTASLSNGVLSYAAPAAWVARSQLHAASVAGPAASPPARTVQRPLSPQGRVNSVTRYTHQSPDASGVVNSRNNSRSPSPLGNRSKVDTRVVTRTNIYAQHVGMSVSPPPGVGGSVPQPLGLAAPGSAPLSRPVSPMAQTRVLSLPQAWSPQHSRPASPQPGATVHIRGGVQNSRPVLRSISPQPVQAVAGVASAPVNRFPHAWSSPLQRTNGYPVVASPGYGANSVNSRSGSVSPMRGATLVASSQMDNAITPLRVSTPWAPLGAGGGSLRR